MVYMGSKRRYCKYIVPIIQKYIDENNIGIFIDLFCGGANLTDKINCDYVYGNDLSPSLIALHKQAQEDFSLIPIDGNREYWDTAYADWKNIKAAMDKGEAIPPTELSLSDIGAIEWYGSFSNGGFPRGYAKPSHGRNYYQEAYRNHKAQAESEKYKKIIFKQGDYKRFQYQPNPHNNILYYADSPYKNTKPYAINPKFNHEEYYDWLREVSKTTPVFISEQWMPDDFEVIWEKETTRTAGKDNNFKACEKLYFIDNREK
jgi:hypothetical protein